VIDYDERIRDLEQELNRLSRLNGENEVRLRQHKLIVDALQAEEKHHQKLVEFDDLVNNVYKKFANEEDSLPDEVDIFEKVLHVREELERVFNFRLLSKKNKGAVAGGFSSGKSTFINSFFKDRSVKLAVGIKPSTAIPSYIVCGDRPEITGYNARGASFKIESDIYGSLTHDKMKSLNFDLRRIIPYITVACPMNEDLLGNICLIDTPGFDPAKVETRREDESTAANAIKDENFLIWLIGLDSGGIIGEASFKFITNEELPFGKGGSEGKPLYIVFNNKANCKTESQLEEIIDFAIDAIENRNLSCAGICAYNPLGGEDSFHIHHKMDLPDFLKTMNTPSANINALQQPLSEVFDRYEFCIENDFRRANKAQSALNKLKDVVYEKIDDTNAAEEINEGFKTMQEQILPDKYRAHLEKLSGIRREFNTYFKSLAREFEVDWAPSPRIKRKRFCNICGTTLDGYFKHCPKCGESTIMAIKAE
jgi:rubrerythrin